MSKAHLPVGEAMAYCKGVDVLLRPGDVCGGNRVIRLLGTGGFAQVYEVVDRRGERRALKILDAEAEARPKVRARLAQEGAALMLLDHANVVRLFDAGMDGDRIYLLLELVEGQNLRDALRRQRPAVETIVRWIRQAAEGVVEAHRRGVIHRDLKPENLLVTAQGTVKVIDFGIAKLHGWGVRTTQEQKLGTALYMSPDQIQGRPPDPRMDVYALGLILYEALAGAHPVVHHAGNVFQVCAQQLSTHPRPLLEALPHLPPELGAVIDRAIAKDPDQRLPDVRSFVEGLHASLLRLGEVRFAALRAIVDALPRHRVIPPTQPMAAVGAPPSLPPDHLLRTEPLVHSASHTGEGPGGALPYAVTAAVRTNPGEPTPLPPPVRVSIPDDSGPPAVVAARPVKQGPGPLVAALLLGLLALAGGAALALRFLGWPF